jgi:hypothetical protein
VERDTLYRPVRGDGARGRVAPAEPVSV